MVSLTHVATARRLRLVASLVLLSVLAACSDDEEGTKTCHEFCQGDEECATGYSCVYGRVNNTKANTVCMPDPCKTCGYGCTVQQVSSTECTFGECK
jgi:hypothetical protein